MLGGRVQVDGVDHLRIRQLAYHCAERCDSSEHIDDGLAVLYKP